MNGTAQRLHYRQTGAFSKLVLDYLDDSPGLHAFYTHRPDINGIKKAIAERKAFSTNRKVLVDYLEKQYEAVPVSEKIKQQLALLLKENTFTITTAHQPNLFTGPLYFIYKILHAVKLAEELKLQLPDNNFVPVYYMGSEDADFEELGHFTLNGTNYQWATGQSGAFGRMVVDKHITKLIDEISGQLLVQPHGKELVDALRNCYKEKTRIQDATFAFVHFLFARYGLIVLIADAKELKQLMVPVFEDELLNHRSAKLVAQTTAELEKQYKVQAGGREINLFYFDEDLRERIEAVADGFAVTNTTIRFTKDEMLKELKAHPERFSPNVILRGLFQETILPNIAFIGGGGELAYWLELKAVFEHYAVPFPVLVLRNSFLVAEEQWNKKVSKLGFTMADFFLPEQELLSLLVNREAGKKIQINGAFTQAEEFYNTLKMQAGAVDTTLSQHVEALKVKTIYRLQELEKKMLRAEKRKFAEQQQQIRQVRQNLFPGNGLQERKESFLSFYAIYGKDFIAELHQHSLSLEQQFVILHVS